MRNAQAISNNYKDLAALLESTRFNQSLPPPPDQCIFYIQFKRILNLGDYMLFTGKKGSAKTKIVSAAIASALTREEILAMRIKLPNEKRTILHLDTEQGRSSHYRTMTQIKAFAGLQDLPEYFSSHRLRGVAPHMIKKIIEYYLSITPDCGMIFLDGMTDTVDDINSVKESKELKSWMERISEQHNVGIIGVMHRGFSADKEIGHSGSFLERGAQTVMKIEKDQRENTTFYVVSVEHIREDAPPDPFSIYYNGQSAAWELFDIVPADPVKIPRNAQKRPLDFDIQEHGRRCGQIFNSKPYLSYKELIQEIAQAYGIGETLAKQEYYQFLMNRFFWKTEQGYTYQQQGKLLLVPKDPDPDPETGAKLFITN